MSHSLQVELTPADETALGYYLIDAADPGLACKAANVSRQRFDEVLSPAIVPYIRGNGVGFARFASAKTIVEGDRLRLDYEVRLTQLNRQHQMCIDAYRRTDEFAKQQFAMRLSQNTAQHPQNDQKELQPLTQKSITGDLRFLQLARAIRHEMDVVEKKLEERLELLYTWQDKAQSKAQLKTQPATPPSTSQPRPAEHNPAQTVQLPSTPTATPPSSPPTPPHPKPGYASEKHAENPAKQAPSGSPIQVLASTTSPLLTKAEFLAELANNKIPTIPQPPRKPDKYQTESRERCA